MDERRKPWSELMQEVWAGPGRGGHTGIWGKKPGGEQGGDKHQGGQEGWV